MTSDRVFAARFQHSTTAIWCRCSSKPVPRISPGALPPGTGAGAGNRRRHGRSDPGAGATPASQHQAGGHRPQSADARACGGQAGGDQRIVWQQADALDLPFDDHEFDAVVCQFGVMFFPDRVAGYREARRVLAPGGRFLFNVWDRIEENAFAHAVTEALSGLYPEDPPLFLARTPHGHHDARRICAELASAGFADVTVETFVLTSRARSRARWLLPTVRARRCATRSRHAVRMGWSPRPSMLQRRSPPGSATGRSRGRSRATSWSRPGSARAAGSRTKRCSTRPRAPP